MKIRTGFVSNSSASSFCIYGTTVERGEMEEILIKKGIATEDEIENEGIYEFVEKLIPAGIEFEMPDEWDEIYFGVSWKNIKDDETGAQFKARVEKELKTILGDSIKVNTYEEAWNG